MGFRFYRSISLGKGVRLNLSKTGVGLSFGIPGFRYSIHSSGRQVQTVGLPGTGLYYRTDRMAGSGRRRGLSASVPGSGVSTSRAPTATLPHAGLFAPRDEKAFVKGLRATILGRHEEALAAFRESMARDPAQRHTAEEYLAGFALEALGRHEEAIEMFRTVVASPIELPDALMRKYGVGGHAEVQVTPALRVTLPHGNLAAALMLAELLQQAGRPEEAAQVLESLGSVAPAPAFALSLADLYAQLGQWRDVVRVTEEVRENVDDVTAQVLVYRARALREQGLFDGALEALREALRSRKRHPEVLLAARYERALAYEGAGRRIQARRELERLYAEDPTYADVARRLGLDPPTGTAPSR